VWGEGPLWRWLGVFITFHAVCFGLLLFSGRLSL
jgi:D-alanyl-lipoteichoic acid acyltransferase DltB (MBOAT superfamily)